MRRNPGWVNRNFLTFIGELEDQGFEIEPAFLFRSFTGIGAGRSRFREVSPDFWENLENSKAWDDTRKSLQSVCQGLRGYGIRKFRLGVELKLNRGGGDIPGAIPTRLFRPVLVVDAQSS